MYELVNIFEVFLANLDLSASAVDLPQSCIAPKPRRSLAIWKESGGL